MNEGMINIFGIIIFIAIIIYVVKNNEVFIEKLEQIKNFKKHKLISRIFLIVFIGISGVIIFKESSSFIDLIDYTLESEKNKKIFEEAQLAIQTENKFYIDCMEKQYDEKYSNPYILDGFHYVRRRVEGWFCDRG